MAHICANCPTVGRTVLLLTRWSAKPWKCPASCCVRTQTKIALKLCTKSQCGAREQPNVNATECDLGTSFDWISSENSNMCVTVDRIVRPYLGTRFVSPRCIPQDWQVYETYQPCRF